MYPTTSTINVTRCDRRSSYTFIEFEHSWSVEVITYCGGHGDASKLLASFPRLEAPWDSKRPEAAVPRLMGRFRIAYQEQQSLEEVSV